MKSEFRRLMERITVVTAILTVLFFILYRLIHGDLWFSLLMTAGTTFYHFAMRLAVGYGVVALVKKKLNYNNFWFRPKRFEKPLYRRLRVKNWKGRVPTYNPDTFSLEKHSSEEIIQTMCISEIVHEVIILLGYASLLFIFLTDDWKSNIWIFLITAVVAGGVDTVFVILQRYNRPRMVRLNRRLTGIEP